MTSPAPLTMAMSKTAAADPFAEEDLIQDELNEPSSVRLDRTNKHGKLIGYSLITETESDTYTENYDLDDNLVSSFYIDINGYSQTSTWEPVVDQHGDVVGQRHSSVSSDGSFSAVWTETCDTEGNLLSSTYSSSDGDWESIERVLPPADLAFGPAPLSHALQITGADADGSTYQRTELFDINGNLVRSEGLNGDGSSELYAIAPVTNDDGTIQGYEGTWTWTDPNGNISTWTDHLDAQLTFQDVITDGINDFDQPKIAICSDQPEIAICPYPEPQDYWPEPAELDGSQNDEGSVVPADWHPEAAPTRIDHTDEFGTLIGYSLITETEWDTYTENFDLDDNLISSTYTNTNGYSQTSTWEALLDQHGDVVGQRHSSVSSDSSFSDSWIETYDTQENLLSSTYSSSDGDWESIERVLPPAGLAFGPAPLSHALEITGADADGSTYQRTELFDINGNLVRSEGLNGDGSSELYAIAPVTNDDGTIQGYEGTWTWTDPNGETTSSEWPERFDLDFNPIGRPIYHKGLMNIRGDLGDTLMMTTHDEPSFAYRSNTGSNHSVLADLPLNEAPVATETSDELPWINFETSPNDHSTDSTDQILESTDHQILPDSIDSPAPSESWPTAEELAYTTSFIEGPALSEPPIEIMPLIISSDSSDVKLNRPDHWNITHASLLGSADLTLRGNKLANVLLGNDGNNRIGGGRGKDLITGGYGFDLFTFRNQRNSFDTITDFNPVEDKFLLKGKVFRDLFSPAGLREGVIGNTLFFDATSGHLLFAPAGEGSGSRPVRLAALPGLEGFELSADLFLLG